MKKLFGAALACLLVHGELIAAENSFYRIEAEIDPAKEWMDLRVDIDFRATVKTAKVRFLIHDDFEIKEVSGPRVASVDIQEKYNPFGLPESHIAAVDIVFAKPLENGESARLHWRYSGWIDPDHIQLGPDATHADWVELDIGSLWHPVEQTLTNEFTYEAHVTAPEDFVVIGAGSRRNSGKAAVFKTDVPHVSASIALSRRLKTLEIDGSPSFTLNHVAPADDLDALASSIRQTIGMFTRLFGELTVTDHFNIILPPSTRARPEGYSRDRYLVISHDMKPGVDRVRFLAHETAHLWWHGAATQGPTNFLNESFAEYSAWLAVRQLFGEAAFEDRVAAAQEALRADDSIHDWNTQDNHRLMYRYGPLVLHKLRARIGDDDTFFALLRHVYANEIRDISQFIAAVEHVAGPSTSEWLAQML